LLGVGFLRESWVIPREEVLTLIGAFVETPRESILWGTRNPMSCRGGFCGGSCGLRCDMHVKIYPKIISLM
jgi:hypothetical protein